MNNVKLLFSPNFVYWLEPNERKEFIEYYEAGRYKDKQGVIYPQAEEYVGTLLKLVEARFKAARSRKRPNDSETFRGYR